MYTYNYIIKCIIKQEKCVKLTTALTSARRKTQHLIRKRACRTAIVRNDVRIDVVFAVCRAVLRVLAEMVSAAGVVRGLLDLNAVPGLETEVIVIFFLAVSTMSSHTHHYDYDHRNEDQRRHHANQDAQDGSDVEDVCCSGCSMEVIIMECLSQ